MFYAPEIPFTPIDALNRRAAAVGSVGYAQAAAGANYNGHRVTVNWNDYRGYYIAQYYWGERRVLGRGTFGEALAAALREYKRGALGCSITVSPREGDVEAEEIAGMTPELVLGDKDPREWYSWRHAVAASTARDSASPGMIVLRFDWPLLQAACSEDAYREALEAKYGRAYT